MLKSAESKHPKLTNREIIFEEFQPMWSRYLNDTDGRTDGQTTCRSNTALCVASRGNNVVASFNDIWSVIFQVLRCIYSHPKRLMAKRLKPLWWVSVDHCRICRPTHSTVATSSKQQVIQLDIRILYARLAFIKEWQASGLHCSVFDQLRWIRKEHWTATAYTKQHRHTIRLTWCKRRCKMNTLQCQKYHVCCQCQKVLREQISLHRSVEWWDVWRCCDEVW